MAPNWCSRWFPQAAFLGAQQAVSYGHYFVVSGLGLWTAGDFAPSLTGRSPIGCGHSV
jgi:hypothetical protein